MRTNLWAPGPEGPCKLRQTVDENTIFACHTTNMWCQKMTSWDMNKYLPSERENSRSMCNHLPSMPTYFPNVKRGPGGPKEAERCPCSSGKEELSGKDASIPAWVNLCMHFML